MTRDFASGLPLIEIAELLIDNVPGYEDREPLELVEGGLDRSDALDELDDVEFFSEEIPSLQTQILALEIEFEVPVDITQYDLGGVYAEREGRKYAWDIVKTEVINKNGGTTFRCELDTDSETFPMGDEYPYTLKDEDLNQYRDLMITAYIGSEFDEAPQSVTLFVRRNGCTIALDGSWE